jgi:phage-related protein
VQHSLYLQMNNKQKLRTVVFYKSYFQDFFLKQRNKVKEKIIWTLDLIEELPRISENHLKHVENSDGLYEIRIQYGSDIFRIFCFFDYGQLVVLMNGFQKKTQKTSKKEIELALKIKKEYEHEQREHHNAGTI